MRIGVFDSGVGGLTVLNKLVSKYPNNHYIYYGDTKNIPYGNKTIDELKILSSNIIEFLINKKVDMIVIACGTISSNLSSYLKNKYDIKIIDIITPVINYLKNNDFDKIGVIATDNTINSKIFSKNLNKDIKEVACTNFVPLIEKNNIDEIDYYLETYLKNLKDRDIIVLGCTHYPIIKDKIQNYLGNSIKLLDMSECISYEDSSDINKVDLYFTYLNENILNNINNILSFKPNSINNILK